MKRFSLGKIIDFLFKNTLIFFIIFVWLRFYLQSLYFAVFLSVLFTLLIGIFFIVKNEKNFNKQMLSKKQTDLLNSYSNELMFNSFNANLNFFKNVINSKKDVKISKNFVFLHENGVKIGIFPFFFKRILTIDDLLNIYVKAKNEQINKLIVVCKQYPQEAENYAKQIGNMNIVLLNQQATYLHLFEPFNYYPKITHKLIEENKVTFKQILNNAFNKKRVKAYLFAGVILMLSSFIISYNLYYIIFSSLCFLLALFSYLNPMFNKHTKQDLFE